MIRACCIAIFCLIISLPVFAGEGRRWRGSGDETCCNLPKGNAECEVHKRGRCGKRKGDCYGMRNPVQSADEARIRLLEYFADRKLQISEISEKKWRFEAELLDSTGKVVDRVMIDKRSGRVRSLY